VLSADLVKKVSAALDRAEDLGPQVHVELEIRGAEQDSDAMTWPGATDVTVVNKWEQLLRRIERMETMSAVSVHGRCSAEALELLLVADHRAVTADTRIHLSTENHDVWPSMALHRLCHQLGLAKARRLVLFGGVLGGEQLHQWGVVDRITAGPASFDLREWGLSASAPSDLPMRRRLLQDAFDSSFDEAFGSHLAACDRTLKRTASRQAVAELRADEVDAA
jgi:isomerase DpgB